MKTKVADNQATFLIQALTIQSFAEKLMPKQIDQSRKILADLIDEVGPSKREEIEAVLAEEYA